MTGKELFNIAQAHAAGRLSGDGPFTRDCHLWLEQHTGTQKALLTGNRPLESRGRIQAVNGSGST
jgi:dTDP-4-amino-4,6-dideoxygalactose transaminase